MTLLDDVALAIGDVASSNHTMPDLTKTHCGLLADAAIAAVFARLDLIKALELMLLEWDKATRYGSPMAKAANERVAYARAMLAKAKEEAGR